MKDKIKQIAEHYGYDSQSHMLIEEMAELTQAINKYYRVRNEHGYPTDKTSGEVFANILEEIADVEICIEELKALLDCNAKVSAWKYTKIARQLERMEKEEDQETAGKNEKGLKDEKTGDHERTV